MTPIKTYSRDDIDLLVRQPCKSAASFEYTTLDEGEIRLLEVFPGNETAIKCQLHRKSLQNLPGYDALSYSWGVDSANCLIELDGRQFFINLNLYEALLVFRESLEQGDSLLIWIDAICINQANDSERANQVRLMGKIYEAATRLRIWLGIHEEEWTEHAVDLLRLWSGMEKLEVIAHVEDLPLLHYSKLLNWVVSFLQRTWFYRAWIVQEYVLSNVDHSIFYSGRIQIPVTHVMATPWQLLRRSPKNKSIDRTVLRAFDECDNRWQLLERSRLRHANGKLVQEHNKLIQQQRQLLQRYDELASAKNELLRRTNVDTELHSQLIRDVDELLLRRNEFVGTTNVETRPQQPKVEGSSTSLLAWLIANRSTKATDPRDKVFSLLALVDHNNYDIQSLIVDYNADVQDVFSSVVRSTVSSTKRLNILGACAGRSDMITRSWTPDWTTPLYLSSSILGFFCSEEATELDKQYIQFRAADESDAIVTFAMDLTTMTLRGWVWDTVLGDVTLPSLSIDGNPSQPLEIYSYQVFWESFARMHRYNSEKEAKASMWRTLLLGTFKQDVPSSLEGYGLEESMNHKYTPEDADLLQNTKLYEKARSMAMNSKVSRWYSAEVLAALIQRDPHNDGILVTSKGYIGKWARGAGTVPGPCSGDLICIVLGSSVPIILRAVGDHYQFVKDAYIDGIMYGEAMHELSSSVAGIQDFVLR